VISQNYWTCQFVVVCIDVCFEEKGTYGQMYDIFRMLWRECDAVANPKFCADPKTGLKNQIVFDISFTVLFQADYTHFSMPKKSQDRP